MPAKGLSSGHPRTFKIIYIGGSDPQRSEEYAVFETLEKAIEYAKATAQKLGNHVNSVVEEP